jgi:hypothetical protein
MAVKIVEIAKGQRRHLIGLVGKILGSWQLASGARARDSTVQYIALDFIKLHYRAATK